MAIDLKGTLDKPVPDKTVSVLNLEACSNIVLVCEHASSFIPAEYDNLGLSNELWKAHIAWDPGALAVAKSLSRSLDATLVHQNVSRLLYDCNRPPEAPSAIPEISEIYPVPGNQGLSEDQRRDRVERFYVPFRDTLGALLAARLAAGRTPLLVTIHSFTPIYKGQPRAVEIGVLHDEDARLADQVLAAARAKGGYNLARNEPYGPADGVTHTLKAHALANGLANVMIEIRNDLIVTGQQQAKLAEWLARVLINSQPDVEAEAG